jgi:hypothetical protein
MRVCVCVCVCARDAQDLQALARQSQQTNVSLRHFRAHQPRRRELNFSASVQRVGYPFQTLLVRTMYYIVYITP